jgi:4-alpha-glucanotransferase
MEPVAELAAQWGVDCDYFDARGQRQVVDPESLARIVAAVADRRDPPRPRLLPPCVVVRRGGDSSIDLPGLQPCGRVRWEIVTPEETVASGISDTPPLRLPASLPIGTYDLNVAVATTTGEVSETTTLVVAPEQAYQGDTTGRMWALAVQLYGVRSRRNWGHGDFADLAYLIEVAATLGAAGIGLNPLHALFHDRAEQASPYAPNSRLFLNPLYIDVAAVPEFPGMRASGLEQEVRRLRQANQVDYRGVASIKLKGLRLAYESFRKKPRIVRSKDLKAFRQERGAALRHFAAFEVLRRRYQVAWWEWPPEWRRPDEAALARLFETDAEELGFYEFVQWNADRQLRACQERARSLGLPLGLYIDVAVGVDAGGADAWSEQGAILTPLAIGAPPDLLNTAGQNWGLAGFNPVELAARRFAPFRRMLAASMRYAGAVRLDHVLGLKRLFVIPHGFDPRRGAYLRFPFEPLLAVIAQESAAHKTIVIGEDLGTVPENFRETVGGWGLWSYQVMLFERAADGGFIAPEHYRRNALVTFSTHDLATFRGWETGHDLTVKRGIGLDPGETDAERDRARIQLREALAWRGLLDDGRIDVAAVTRFLAATPSRLLVVSLEDVLEIADQPNVPGTVTEHANWLRRLPVTIEDLATDERLTNLARMLQEAGRAIPSRGPG